MYFADICPSPQIVFEICAGWGARSIMTEKFQERNDEKRERYEAEVERDCD